MNIEQERKDFEAWCTRQYPVLLTYVWIDNPDRYFSDYTQAAWEAWQARAALQSQDREDADRLRFISTDRRKTIDRLAEFVCAVEDFPYMSLLQIRAAIDRARRIEGDGE